MFSPHHYASRRLALVREISIRHQNHSGKNDESKLSSAKKPGIILLTGARDCPRNYRDNTYPFRQDSTFLYFAGLKDPGLDLAIDCASGKSFLSGKEPGIDDLIWTGPLPSIEDRAAAAGIETVLDPAGFANLILQAKNQNRPIHYISPYRDDMTLHLARLLGVNPSSVPAGSSGDLVGAAIALRSIKDEVEIQELEKAVGITVQMHKAVLREARAGMRESQLAAIATTIALSHGGELAFPIISTRRGEVLHNTRRDGILAPGDLVVFDAGAETELGYAGDLTTSFPVSARFSERQKTLYSLLISVFSAATEKLGPGKFMRDAHLASSLALARGLVELGLMQGDPEEAVAEGAHALFFPHGLGHMMGLDVHDMENYGEDLVGYDEESGPRSKQFGLRSLRLARKLCPGMVHTVEPGIYFIPGLIAAWKEAGTCQKFMNFKEIDSWIGTGGMRLEEDWLITRTGARRMGPAFNRSIADIESARSSS